LITHSTHLHPNPTRRSSDLPNTFRRRETTWQRRRVLPALPTVATLRLSVLASSVSVVSRLRPARSSFVSAAPSSTQVRTLDAAATTPCSLSKQVQLSSLSSATAAP